MNHTFSLNIELPVFPFGTLTATVEGTYYPSSPGRLSGPPEDCYPPTPEELTIDSLTICNFTALIPPEKNLIDFISEDDYPDLEVLVLEALDGEREAAKDDAAEARAYNDYDEYDPYDFEYDR